jgi:inosine-uridine nucleoside N-ribohydrolase
MKADLAAAAARGRREHIAVLGPTTDVACLLVHWPELAKVAVEAVVFLGSQPAGERCATSWAYRMAAAGVLLQ